MRFVALGDSITVGLGDAMPDGRLRGWAGLLADGLAEPGTVEYHNLAALGARAHTVAAEQLPAALALRPTIASVIVGVNDTLWHPFDVEAIGRALAHTVGSLHDAGALVLTARLPEPGRMFGLPGALARPLARRIAAINAAADRLAERYDTVHFDAYGHPDTYDRRMWSVDRLHPSERGHRLLAGAYADLLVARGVRLYRRPSPEPTNPPPTRRSEVVWMLTKGTRWLRDRCTDLLPHLIRMAAVEWWRGARGVAVAPDERTSCG